MSSELIELYISVRFTQLSSILYLYLEFLNGGTSKVKRTLSRKIELKQNVLEVIPETDYVLCRAVAFYSVIERSQTLRIGGESPVLSFNFT